MEKESKKNTEHRGVVEFLSTERGYGQIRSEEDQALYFFYLSSFPGAQFNNPVRFFPFRNNGKSSARSIRKCYKNKFGIEFVSRVNSHHIHLDLDYYLPLIFDRIESITEDFLVKEFQFPTIVGDSACVPTSEDDTIIYARRKGRKGHTRFVKNRTPIESSHITIALKKVDERYLLITIYVGRKAGPEPWDEFATKEDLQFWNNHALLFDSNVILPGTESKTCPWWNVDG